MNQMLPPFLFGVRDVELIKRLERGLEARDVPPEL
jgi:hypothetical protein